MFKAILLAIAVVHAVACTNIPASTLPPISAPDETYCEGAGWISFQDEKCFKLIRKWATQEEARELCADQKLPEDLFAPTLPTIRFVDEQQFLVDYLYRDSGIKVNVWLGAKRSRLNGTQFRWEDDGEVVERFDNWAEDSPTGEDGRDCVEMQSKFTRNFDLEVRGVEGKWRDVTCEQANYVVCQKYQHWSFAKLKKVTIETRRELVYTKSDLADANAKLDSVKYNDPVPLGFIYVQLPKEPEPKILWPTVEWKDVSSEYAGLFFRADGGEAAAFGKVQADNSPRVTKLEITDVDSKQDLWPAWHNTELNLNNWSTGVGVYTGDWTGVNNGFKHFTMKFFTSGGEVRPKNMAMRIWKRV